MTFTRNVQIILIKYNFHWIKVVEYKRKNLTQVFKGIVSHITKNTLYLTQV